MKTVEIIGYKRANLGKKDARDLRVEGNVPCVLYGGDEQIHFYAPAYLFRELVYTAEAHFAHINVEGKEYRAILQDIQFHPVSDIILHADFFEIHEGRPIKMDIPVHFEGKAPGVEKGGTLVKKRRLLRVKALPKNMPEHITVDISELDFHSSIKVQHIETENFDIMDADRLSVAVVEIPRALRGKSKDELDEAAEVEGEEGAEGAEGSEA
ncbi:50S ribosomal protein L25/general stress protein Ctc [Mangrovivirga sp. M17]|uniref:Large ribosomal subunit protein bL25 n=1 Tax=Mangrovivirga halotolerans TaxID=2993936 RepID=A0ABT3RLT1_9BACT|nr:50S ribosomal protein L25/general stress protein Ctc [Mangrovivirga halotolerans]MCX2742473.1 50S ribosomal protein L25/general stress protein Ctc [Mangrovivirga halotolerans]